MRIYEGRVYCLSSAVEPLSDDFHCYFLDIPGKKRGFVHFGKDRWFEIGVESRLFLNFRNAKQVWSVKHLKVPFVKKNNRWEFDLPEYLETFGIKVRLHDRYDFYNGDNTNYHMICCKNAIVSSGSYYRTEYPVYWISIDFPRTFVTINGKAVLNISADSSNQFKGFEDFIRSRLDQPVDLNYPQLLELAGRFMVNPGLPGFVIRFRDKTTVKGNGIDWENNMLK